VAVPPGKAAVYFFREHKSRYSAIEITLSIPLAANNCFGMDSGGYYAYVSDPGALEVLAVAAVHGTPQAKFAIDLKPGDVRYVEVEYDGGPKVQETTSADANKLLGDTKLIGVCKQ
jgi:hypothetical protein